MRRVQVRCGRTTACVAGVLLAAIAAFAASAAVARTWKSKAGSYQVEADLVKVENGKVTLRKAGGETITVDESRLCDADRAYLHSGNSADADDQSGKVVGEEAAPEAGTPVEKKKPRTFADLSAESNECAAADEVLALYKEFLADSSIDESELLAARNNLPIWESRAAKKMVRFGTRWLEPKQLGELRKKANGYRRRGDRVGRGQAVRQGPQEVDRRQPPRSRKPAGRFPLRTDLPIWPPRYPVGSAGVLRMP